MSELLSQLGINWKLLVSQGVNFFIVLAVLTIFVWRPLLRILAERRARIEEGLDASQKANERLLHVEEEVGGRIAEAEGKALSIIKHGEQKAAERSTAFLEEAEQKAAGVLQKAAQVARQREAEEFQQFTQKAASLVRTALAKTVREDPRQVDEKLVQGALQFIKQRREL